MASMAGEIFQGTAQWLKPRQQLRAALASGSSLKDQRCGHLNVRWES